MRLYICVLDGVPDYMVPTLVAHTMLGAHIEFTARFAESIPLDINPYSQYFEWLNSSFKKCVCMVNQKEFDKITAIPYTYLGHENHTLEGRKSCAIPIPVEGIDLPNVLRFAKLWKPS